MQQASADIINILDRITDGVVAFDHQWRVTYMNKTAGQLMPQLQKTPEELIGKDIWDEFPDLIGTRVYEEFHRAVSQQAPVAFELFYPPLDTWSEIRAYPSPNGLSVYFQDVTERKRGEKSLAERTRIAMLSADVGIALTQGVTLQDMLRHCAEAIVQHLDAAFARIWTLRADENVLALQASVGMYTHLDGPHGRVPVGKYKIGLIAEERQPHLTNSVVGDPLVGDQEWAKREGMVAFAGYPLIVEERLVGVIAMFARKPLSEAVLQAMSAIAHGIALGIERKQTEEERSRLREEIIQMQAARLEELSTPLIPLSDQIVVMPLIGSIDAQRVDRVIDTLSAGMVSKGARIAIIDITGVPMVDTYVANAIIKAAQVLRLLGAEAVLTGVRPPVAQTLAGLDVDLSSIVTRSTLQSGIDYARERLRIGSMTSLTKNHSTSHLSQS